jgi:hypothetical protein
MLEAAEAVLGHPIPVDFKEIRYPDHYVDGRGVEMYGRVRDLLAKAEAKSLILGSPLYPSLPSSRTRACARTFSKTSIDRWMDGWMDG